MKKAVALLLSLVLVFIITACAPPEVIFSSIRSDDDVALEIFEKIIAAIEEKDEEGLKNLFSKQAISESENFDEDTKKLFEFYKGKMTSYYDWGSPGSTGGKNETGMWNYLDATYDIETTEEEYKMSFIYYEFDTSNEDNVGVYSFYIIEAEDFFRSEFEPEDSRTNLAYGGDGKKTPGITIEVYDESKEENY